MLHKIIAFCLQCRDAAAAALRPVGIDRLALNVALVCQGDDHIFFRN